MAELTGREELKRALARDFPSAEDPAAAARPKLVAPGTAPREVMDIRHAAAYLGFTPDALYQYASQGLLPAFKLGNRWRFKRSKLDEWMDAASDLQGCKRYEEFKRKGAAKP